MKSAFDNSTSIDASKANMFKLEMLSIEIQYCFTTGNKQKLREIHEMTMALNSSYADPMTSAVINESSGKILMM